MFEFRALGAEKKLTVGGFSRKRILRKEKELIDESHGRDPDKVYNDLNRRYFDWLTVTWYSL